jgi:ribosomal protein L11 methyltransferase
LVADARRWLVLTIDAPSEDAQAIFAEGLLALGAGAVQENDTQLVTYIPEPDDAERFIAHAREMLGTDISWRWQDDEDWSESWKRGLRPRRVGKSFVVAPSWTRPDLRAGDRVIVIDPEMAFGTGEHGTTRGALRFIEQVVQPGMRVLDVGTGSAILAIGAAMLGARKVVAVDNDPDAILNAKDNVSRNEVGHAIELVEILVDEPYLADFGEGAFDVIVANVLSGVLKPLLPAFYRSLSPDGHVILGGILESEARDMLDALAAAGFRVRGEDLEEEWWGVLAQKPPVR